MNNREKLAIHLHLLDAQDSLWERKNAERFETTCLVLGAIGVLVVCAVLWSNSL